MGVGFVWGVANFVRGLIDQTNVLPHILAK